MTIYLKKCTSPNNKIGKSFDGSPLEIIGTLRGGSSVVDPRIEIGATNPSGYNYMEIPDFGRKYYITDISVEVTGMWVITAHVDVLDTYAEQIKESHGIIERRTNGINRYMDMGLIPAEARTISSQHLFTADSTYKDETRKTAEGKASACFPGDGWQYYLITAGPGGTTPTPSE